MSALLRRDEVGRFAAGPLVALVAALATGPSGTGDEPFRGIEGALLRPRVLPFLLVGVIAGAIAVARGRGTLPAVPDVAAPVRRATGALGANAPAKWGMFALLAAFLILYPRTLSSFWQGVLVENIAIYILLALGLNIVVGLAGLLDLGYIAFFAIGAYMTAYLSGGLPVKPPVELNPFLILPIAILAAMIAGVVLGAPVLRLRGDYLAIVTLGFGEIIRILAVNGDNTFGRNITDGPRGASVPSLSIDIGPLEYQWGLSLLPYYYLLLGLIVLLVIGFRRLDDSRIGRAWTAIREDEVAAAATGVPTVRYKLLAFAIGASTSGFAGVFYSSQVGFIAPDNFRLDLSILVLTMVIFGGMGSIWGVMLGAAILQWLPNLLREYVDPADRYIFFGALVVAMMIFRPQGILPSKRRAREIKLTEEGQSGADAMSAGLTPGTPK